jgi:hypothetical protein
VLLLLADALLGRFQSDTVSQWFKHKHSVNTLPVGGKNGIWRLQAPMKRSTHCVIEVEGCQRSHISTILVPFTNMYHSQLTRIARTSFRPVFLNPVELLAAYRWLLS